MRTKKIKTPPFAFYNHPKLAAYPKALALDGEIVASGALDVHLHVDKHPPTFATIEGQTYLIANLLSLHLNLQVLDRNEFVAVICDPTEYSQHANVERFAHDDDALHTGLVRALTPSTASTPTNIRRQHLKARQICPVCVSYESDKVKPLEVPLSADQNWRGARARGLGGVVKCRRCKFRLTLSHEEYSRFLDSRLPISEIVTMRLEGNQPVICPACAARGRHGIVLMRWYEDCIVTRCSHCLYDLEAYSLRAEAA